ncbi:MAG: winged helix-turn-helix transcriptional regulator [Methanoregulaceae archaeon]
MRKKGVVFLIILLLVPTVILPTTGGEIQVQSGYIVPPPAGAIPVSPAEVSFWELPLWIIVLQIVLLPGECLLLLKFLVPLRYREISSQNVLFQDVRARIYNTIRNNPGIHLHGISQRTGIGIGTARYHLRMLLRTHKVTLNRDAGSIHFFEKRGAYTGREQEILKHLQNPTARKLIHTILENPEASRHHLAAAAGISGSSVTWHIKRLEADGIVASARIGRTVAYTVPSETLEKIREYERISGET